VLAAEKEIIAEVLTLFSPRRSRLSTKAEYTVAADEGENSAARHLLQDISFDDGFGLDRWHALAL
jgi:hypothetical protein